MKPAPDDDVFAALRELPTHTAGSETDELIARRARAELAWATNNASWHERLVRTSLRAAVPTVLAGVVGVYLTWAITAAAALMR